MSDFISWIAFIMAIFTIGFSFYTRWIIRQGVFTREQLREVRRTIAQIEVRDAEGLRVRGEALTICFNMEHKLLMSRKEKKRAARAE